MNAPDERNRRSSGRQQLDLLVDIEYVSPGEGTPKYSVGRTRDISNRGAFILTVNPVAIGQKLNLTIEIPAATFPCASMEVRCEAVVVRHKTAGNSNSIEGIGVLITRFGTPYVGQAGRRWLN